MFDQITREHVLLAFEQAEGLPIPAIQANYLIHKGVRYPPKHIVRLAYQIAYGAPAPNFISNVAIQVLARCGFETLRTDAPKQVNTDQINYWVFQGKPAQFQNGKALEDGSLQTWRVTAHTERIRPGDKIILWVTGPEAGCYALAEVASDVYTEIGNETVEDDQVSKAVEIKIVLNLWDRPVLKAELQDLPPFSDFNGGSQGTNFRATQEQYEAIELLARPTIPTGVRRFWKYSAGSQAAHWWDDVRDQIMTIDFSAYNTGPLDQYATQTDLDNHLGKPPRVSNETWNMMLFKDAAIGDVVIANRGRNTVIGIGIISGPYQYRADTPYNQHYRAVDWLADQSWQYTANQFSGNQNLFRVDTFSPTRVGPQIIQAYVNQYPQYRPVFEEHGLLEPIQPADQPMPEPDNRYAKNIILYGPPGTGKTYETIDLAVDIVDGGKDDSHKVNKARFDQLRQEGRIEFVTFHQNYTYEDFVMGLKPDVDGETEGLRFERREGVFYRISKQAEANFMGTPQGGQIQYMPFEEAAGKLLTQLDNGEEVPFETKTGVPFSLIGLTETKKAVVMRLSSGATYDIGLNRLKQAYQGSMATNNNQRTYYEQIVEFLRAKGAVKVVTPVKPKNYVLIIDEINRANMSRVFGELITLLEDDKRLGAENALTVTLSSGELFSVPPNLYLIGTMNTADKSLALLDVALRRRFEFIGKYPNYEVVDGPAKGVLERLNKAILAHHKPADFLIGHAYFIGKQTDQLPGVFNNRVIPLLMEYFNGRTDLVRTLLADAGIKSKRHPLTDQLTVDHVD